MKKHLLRAAVLAACLLAVGVIGWHAFDVPTADAQWPDQELVKFTKPYATAVCSLVVNDASRPERLNLTPPTGFTYFDRIEVWPTVASGAQVVNFSFWMSSTTDSTAGLGYTAGIVNNVSGASGIQYMTPFDIRCKYARFWNFAATDDFMIIAYCRE